MKQNQILIPTDETLSELLEVISDFDKQQFNTTSQPESWTPSQITQHLVLSISGFVDLMNGPTEETTRNPDAHVEIIKSIFLDFSKKLKSPEFIVPEKKNYDKEDLLRRLANLKEEVKRISETNDLEKTCTKFQLPTIGYLTKVEALAFIVFHSQRHIQQLRQMAGVPDIKGK